MFSDFKTYPDQFLYVIRHVYLVSSSFTHKDVQPMYTEDVIDDADLAAPVAPPLIGSSLQQLHVFLPESMTESELTTTFLNHNVVFVLPSPYRPPTFGSPETDMIVFGIRV